MSLKHIMTWVLLISILLFVGGIIRNTTSVVTQQKRLAAASKKVQLLEKQKQQLLFEQTRKNSPEYINQQIRDKLKLVKPGETLVVLPTILQERIEEKVYKYNTEEKTAAKITPIWQQWLNLFL